MKKYILFFFILLMMCNITACSAIIINNTEDSSSDVRVEDTRYNEVLNEIDYFGWSDSCSLEESNWLVYYSKTGESLEIIKSKKKQILEENHLSFKQYCDMNVSYISMIDDENGFILCCSSPAGGMMSKYLFKTSDGWKSYQMIAELTEEIQNYPTDMAFSDGNTGIITVNHHSFSVYIYLTTDGGDSWSEIIVDDFEDEFFYVEGKTIQWKEGQWILSLSGIRKMGKIQLQYTSLDGKTWAFVKGE